MSFFKNAYQKLKDKVFGVGPAADLTPGGSDSSAIWENEQLDIGPAKKWYIKRLLNRSIFTKKLTPSRAQHIREVFRRLRPEQRAIALRRGWNRGLDV